MAKTEARSEGSSGGSSSGGLVGLVVVTVLAVVCGAGFGFFLDGQMRSQAVVKAGENDKEPEKPEDPKSTVPVTARLVALSPIVVNLAEPKDTWMRIEASILVDGMSQGHETLAAHLAEDMVAYLRTTTLAQFEGASGFMNLREDFLDRAAIRDREHIKDVIIHGVVVE